MLKTLTEKKRKSYIADFPNLPLPVEVSNDFEMQLKIEKKLRKQKMEQKEKTILKSIFGGYNN